MTDENDLVYRLHKRAEIRRQITTRKSVQNNEPDRIADLLQEAALAIEELQGRSELMQPHETGTDDPVDFPRDSHVPRLLDPGCSERGCMAYSPFADDADGVEFYSRDYVEQLESELKTQRGNSVLVPADKLADMQAEITDLRQQVAFLEDWRAVWAPVIRQHQGLE